MDTPHNVKADQHFKEAEAHVEAGRHKEAWTSLGHAQAAAAKHAYEMAIDGKHQAATAYKKIVLGRVGHLANKMRKSSGITPMDDFQLHRIKALSVLWEVMKKEGPGRYKYAIPQIELAKTKENIDTVCRLYGVDLNRWGHRG